MKFYNSEKLEAAINLKYKNVAELDGCELTIEPQKMQDFFHPTVDWICHDAFLALERVKREVKNLEAVYLVRGFGGCRFVKKVVQDTLQDEYGPRLSVIIPTDNKMAIACGAIIFRRNPEIIWAHRADATYGDILRAQFHTGVHDPAHMIIDERGEYLCDSLFRPYIEAGDTTVIRFYFVVKIFSYKENVRKYFTRILFYNKHFSVSVGSLLHTNTSPIAAAHISSIRGSL